MFKQSLELKQTQKLSPLQIQTIKLIELPIQELEQRIRKELEENPVLDEDLPKDKEEDEAPEVAFGYIDVHKIDKQEKVRVVWLPRVKFALPSETSNTRGETTTFSTPSILTEYPSASSSTLP